MLKLKATTHTICVRVAKLRATQLQGFFASLCLILLFFVSDYK